VVTNEGKSMAEADDIKAWIEKHGELTALMPADPTPYQRAMLDMMTAKDPAERQEALKRLSTARRAKPFSATALRKTMAEAAEYHDIERQVRMRFRSAKP
jgi:hypothetical protein